VYKPLVSVIVPVYNVKRFLSESLNSVINQTYKRLEIIVVDDGSTDGSEAICDEFAAKDSRIRVIHQENKGLSGARNTGLDVMTGEIVAFIDSDDAFLPTMIEKMVCVMNESDVDIVMCKYYRCRTRGRLKCPKSKGSTANRPIISSRKEALRGLLGCDNWYAWNKLYRRECFDKIDNQEGRVYEDVETTYRLINSAKSVATLDERLILYRRWGGSITSEYRVNSARDRVYAYARVQEYVEKNIPDIFTDDHEQRIRGIRIDTMLSLYVRLGKEAREFRKTILEVGKRLDLKKCGLRIRWLYILFLRVPHLFKFGFLFFVWCKNRVKALIEFSMTCFDRIRMFKVTQ